jgi:hypothetical protein
VFLAYRQKQYAKRLVRQLLKSHAAIRARAPELTGASLYAEVLMHSRLVEPSRVGEMISQAEDSIDEWTTHKNKALGFREVVHFVLLSQFQGGSELGPVISFKNIVYSLVPADL